ERAGVRVGRAGRPARFLGIGRAGRARARTGLGGIALPGRRATDRPRVPRRVLAGRARSVALVQRADVAIVRAGRSARLQHLGRAGGARARAGLGNVALARRRAADAPGVPGGMRARGARPAADVPRAHAAIVRAGRPARLEDIGDARRARARAVLRNIALVGRRAAHRAGGLEGVGGTGRTRARAGLRDVAHIRRNAADRPRIARRMLAREVRPVAAVQGARVGVGRAGHPARLLRVRRTGRARTRALLVEVALARRRAADRPRIPG